MPTGPPGLLRIPMSRPQSVTPRSNQLPYALRIGFTLPSPAVVPVLLSGPGTLVPTNFDHPVWSAGRGAMYSPIATRARFDQVALELPGGSCITGTTSGIFVPDRASNSCAAANWTRLGGAIDTAAQHDQVLRDRAVGQVAAMSKNGDQCSNTYHGAWTVEW